MKVSRNERGEGGLKPILLLAVLAYGVFVGVKIVPAISDDGSIQKGIEEVVKFAGPQSYKQKDVEYRVNLKIQEYKIPVKPEDVQILDEGSSWHVKFKYHRAINLIFWTWKKDVEIDQTGQK